MSHPDDESFGPGGTIAKYAALGAEIHLLCATRGESGQWSDTPAKNRKLADVREVEHRKATAILGISSHEYMGYIDGYLSNILMDDLVTKIEEKITSFQPDILLTFDLLGLSGHIDHITMTMATTKAFEESKKVKKLYYFVHDKKITDLIFKTVKIKLWGRRSDEITTRIDVKKYLPIKIKAANCHVTQKKDIDRLMWFWRLWGKTETFVLAQSRVKTKLAEIDLFDGIK